MADPNPASRGQGLQPETPSEDMPDLPGSGTPPIEGRSWVQVKVAVWAGVGVVLAGLAWGVASLLT